MRQLIYRVVQVAVSRGAGTLATLAVTAWVAKELGAVAVGSLNYFLLVALVAGTLGRFGIHNVLLRWFAEGDGVRPFADVQRGLFAAAVSTCIVLVVGYVVFRLARFAGASHILAHWGMFASYVLLWVIGFVAAGAMQGAGAVVRGVFLQSSLTPLAALAIIFSFGISSLQAVYIAFAVGAGGMAAVAFMGLRLLARMTGRSDLSLNRIYLGGRHFLAVDVLVVVNNWAPVLVMGSVVLSQDLGVFSVAGRIAWLVSFVVVSLNSIVSPRIAAMAKNQDVAGLRKLSSSAIRLSSFMSAAIVVPLFIASGPVMAFFGEDFRSGGVLLKILLVGQFFNGITGPSNAVLLMGGGERILWRILIVICIVNIVGCMTAVAVGDIVSVAVVVATCVCAQNIWTFLSARKVLSAGRVPA